MPLTGANTNNLHEYKKMSIKKEWRETDYFLKIFQKKKKQKKFVLYHLPKSGGRFSYTEKKMSTSKRKYLHKIKQDEIL